MKTMGIVLAVIGILVAAGLGLLQYHYKVLTPGLWAVVLWGVLGVIGIAVAVLREHPLSPIVGHAVAVAMLLVGVLTLNLWPESKQRIAGKEIDRQTKMAGRLQAKNFSLLTRSGYTIAGGKDEAVSPEDIKLRKEPMALDEQALKGLQDAEKELKAVVEDNGGVAKVNKEILAQAYVRLADIARLRVEYHAQMAAKARRKTRDDRRKAYVVSTRMGAETSNVKQYITLTAQTTAEVEAEQNRSKQEATTLEGQIKESADKITSMSKRGLVLNSRNEKLMERAGSLRIASHLADKAKVGLSKFDEALKLEDEVNKNKLEIDRLEIDILMEKAKRRDMEILVAVAKTRAELAGDIIKDRADQKTHNNEVLTKLKDDLGKTQAEIEALAKSIIKASNEANADADKGVAACKAAQGYLAEAVKLQPQKKKGETRAAEADVMLNWGRFHARRLAEHNENELLVKDLERTWPDLAAGGEKGELPQILKDLRALLPAPGEVRAAAKKKYDEAIKTYDDALNKVPPQLKWVYEGQMAQAHLAVYRLLEKTDQPDPDSLKKASELLDHAVMDKTSSPFVKPLVEVRRSLPK